jgi:hypothetical protein
MSQQIDLSYDGDKKSAVLTFTNGRTLKLSNVTEAQAKAFQERHAPEFQRRDCILHSVDGIVTRGASNG